MDVSKIQESWVVNAKNPGMNQGPCVVNIGIVERVEDNGYIKLARNDDLDGRAHWLPIGWVESADEGMVCLNQTAEQVMAGLLDELPQG